MTTITHLSVRDIRFPTSRSLDGSDAMNAAPDYSATYAILETDAPEGLAGHGLTFTIGRGNEVCRGGGEGAGAARRRQATGRHRRRHGRVLARDHRPTASCAGSARRKA